MATVVLKKVYRCFDDCKQSGCPTHEAVLEFNTVTNSYKYMNGSGTTYRFEQGELEAFVTLLKELHEVRFDSLSI